MKHLVTLLKSIVLLAISFFFGAFLAIAAGAPDLAVPLGSTFVALSFIPKGTMSVGKLCTITATDVVAEWGAVYRAEGQNIKDLMTKLMQPSVTASYFPVRITEKTILERSVAEFTRVLQRFQKAWTPIGNTTFTPTAIPLQPLKIDLEDTPDDIEESWLGFLASKKLDRKEWPFIKWYLTNALIQADQDLELNEIYGGVTGTITPGTATAAGTSLKGIKLQINEMDTAGTGSKVVLGAVPTTDGKLLVEYIQDLVNGGGRLLKNQLDFVFVNEDLHDLFRDGMREKYNINYEQVADNKITRLRNDNIQIVGLPSMVGSTKIWSTPEWNRQSGFKKPGNEKIFKVETVDRKVKAFTDYYKGFGFWISEYVLYNDVELTDEGEGGGE